MNPKSDSRVKVVRVVVADNGMANRLIGVGEVLMGRRVGLRNRISQSQVKQDRVGRGNPVGNIHARTVDRNRQRIIAKFISS
jgi:hypothetical protein